ncbi:MAG: manganese transporter [Flavobacteriaceae bacterium]|nr:manganese transporter [Flavobacteriaceae bacterium]
MCSVAGAKFGYSLIWALFISILLTLFIQLMAIRIGINTKKSLSVLVREQFENKILKYVSILLVISAIFIGNTAYEAGNISGAVMGAELLFNKKLVYNNVNIFSVCCGFLAFLLIAFGNNRSLEKVLIFLVLIMSFSFVFTVFIVGIDFQSLFSFSNFFHFPSESILIVAGLIGTTVVPYNIFLHVALVNSKWKNVNDINTANFDAIISISIGGLISLCILLTAAGLNKSDILNAVDLANSLEPLYGNFSKLIIALGLFSAGLTSSITAPLAAAYVLCGCLGFESDRKSVFFRFISIIVLVIGVISSSLGISSIEIIKFAQITNGILLPLIVIFLMILANNSKLLKNQINSIVQNLIGVLVIGFCLLLCVRSVIKVFF